MTNSMDNIEKYQKQLLEQTQNLYRDTRVDQTYARAQKILKFLNSVSSASLW